MVDAQQILNGMTPIELIWLIIQDQGNANLPDQAVLESLEELASRFFKQADRAAVKRDLLVWDANEEPLYHIHVLDHTHSSLDRKCADCRKRIEGAYNLFEKVLVKNKKTTRILCPSCFIKKGFQAGLEREAYAFSHWHSGARRWVHSDIVLAVSSPENGVWDGHTPALLEIRTVCEHIQKLDSGNIQIPFLIWAVEEGIGRYLVSLGVSPLDPTNRWLTVRQPWACTGCQRTIRRMEEAYDGLLPFRLDSGRYCTTCLAEALADTQVDDQSLPAYKFDYWDYLEDRVVTAKHGSYGLAMRQTLDRLTRAS